MINSACSVLNQSNLAVELVGQFLCPVTGQLLKPINKKKCTVHDMSASRYYKISI